MAVPSAVTPSKVYFILSPWASTVRVRLLGAAPELYFDFARLSFQAPTRGFCASRVVAAAQARTVTAANASRRFIFLSCESTERFRWSLRAGIGGTVCRGGANVKELWPLRPQISCCGMNLNPPATLR